MRSLLLTLLLSSAVPLFAESRTWKSADGASSFSGEYVSHDDKQVTIRREDGKVFTVAYTKLHPDDKTWVAAQPENAGGKAGAETEAAPDPKAIFDTLCFGDSIDTVKKKLKESKAVETTLDDTYLGRTGINGVYHTRQKIGGLHCELFFDWTAMDTLNEVMLQTQGQTADVYPTQLKDTWTQLVELMGALHGKPVQAGSYPGVKQVKDDMFLPTHLWKLQSGGSALLGVSMQQGAYLVVVRFTTEKVQPTALP
ncbi:hypothetical protein [Luteolibacter soli]|uniref:SLA1 homology domain-containing protein n=1 Tax=Luteolibacter soli TaxID=3135280 RepID=A0ABU9AZC0_9BACT